MARKLPKWIAWRPLTWFFLRVAPPLDRALLRWSRGRFSAGGRQPVLLLTSRGARSGEWRASPLLFVRDGERLVLVASRGGSARHPGWYHNLRQHPEARVLLDGVESSYRAYEAEGEERERLWRKALEINPGYETYQERAGARRIPVMVLRPAPR